MIDGFNAHLLNSGLNTEVNLFFKVCDTDYRHVTDSRFRHSRYPTSYHVINLVGLTDSGYIYIYIYVCVFLCISVCLFLSFSLSLSLCVCVCVLLLANKNQVLRKTLLAMSFLNTDIHFDVYFSSVHGRRDCHLIFCICVSYRCLH